MVDAHMHVELDAYDAPDFTERSEAAETGSARSAMLLQDALGFTGGLIDVVAVASVLALVHPVLLPLLLLSVIPRGLGSVYAARLDYRLHNATVASRNIKASTRVRRSWSGGQPMSRPRPRRSDRHAVRAGSTNSHRASDRSLGHRRRSGMIPSYPPTAWQVQAQIPAPEAHGAQRGVLG